MKHVFALLPLALSLSGCGPTRSDILLEITAEEQRLARLEKELTELDAKFENLIGIGDAALANAGSAAGPEQIDKMFATKQKVLQSQQEARAPKLAEIARCRVKIAELRHKLN